MHSEKISLDVSVMQDLFGVGDTNITAIETALSVSVSTRGGFVEVSGEEANVRLALDTLRTLEKMHKNGETLNDFAVSRAIELVREGQGDAMVAAMQDTIAIAHNGAPIKCRTIGQRKYVDAIRKNTVTICIGPAGTGKTYLAVAAVVGMLKRKEIERIVMCRPAVEAGEKLGFLPGDLQNKVDPYLRPLYDALDELLGHDTVQRYIENRRSAVRCKVEHPYRIVKNIFGFRKTVYRGLRKNLNRLHVLFASANLYMLARAGGSLRPAWDLCAL